MASAIIHLAVAKTLEKYLDIENKKDYYLGSIAPDISKQIGENNSCYLHLGYFRIMRDKSSKRNFYTGYRNEP